MMKFGANVTQTALKDLNLAQAGNYDHVLNLKYTCRALPSCYYTLCQAQWPIGVVSWTCDTVLALGQGFDSHSRRSFCCNPLG